MFRHLFSFVLLLGILTAGCSGRVSQRAGLIEIPADEIHDRIYGGLLGQILGNLNGKPHEDRHIPVPGDVPPGGYTPGLYALPGRPEGGLTDDDTSIEWMYIYEMQRSNTLLIPYPRIMTLWRTYMNSGIFSANLHARGLIELDIEPPLTGQVTLNPWGEFNIAGQFCCETFGLAAPAMPRTAAGMGSHYTSVVIDGEPAQTTRFFTTMIAESFLEHDIERLLDSGLAALDPASNTAAIVRTVRRWHREHPDDWLIVRKQIHDTWTKHNGTVRDFNGYELNTASIVAAMLYGQGDFVESLRHAFNIGWDADCNAAAVGTIIGVIYGAKRILSQGWFIPDVYHNFERRTNSASRPGMPMDETISRFAGRIVDVARLAVQQNGGAIESRENGEVWRIPREPVPDPVLLTDPNDQAVKLRSMLLSQIEQDLTGEPVDRARAAYLAICLDEWKRLQATQPEAWSAARDALQQYTAVLQVMHNFTIMKPPIGDALIARMTEAGLTIPY